MGKASVPCASVGVQRLLTQVLRASAALALGRFQQAEAHAALIELLDERDDEFNHLPKGFAMMVLGEQHVVEAAPQLLSMLSDRSERDHLKTQEQLESPLRGLAAVALGLYARSIQTPQGPTDPLRTAEVIQALTDRLRDDREKTEVRSAAAVALGLTGRAEALPALQRVTTGLTADDEPLVGYVLQARGMLGDLGLLEHSARFLSVARQRDDMDSLLARRAAGLGLGYLGTAEAIPILAATSADNYYVGREIILALAMHQAHGVVHALAERLREAKNPAEREFMAEALGRVLLKDTADPLQVFLAHSNYTVRQDPRRPFQGMANRFLMDYLIPAMGEHNWH